MGPHLLKIFFYGSPPLRERRAPSCLTKYVLDMRYWPPGAPASRHARRRAPVARRAAAQRRRRRGRGRMVEPVAEDGGWRMEDWRSRAPSRAPSREIEDDHRGRSSRAPSREIEDDHQEPENAHR